MANVVPVSLAPTPDTPDANAMASFLQNQQKKSQTLAQLLQQEASSTSPVLSTAQGMARLGMGVVGAASDYADGLTRQKALAAELNKPSSFSDTGAPNLQGESSDQEASAGGGPVTARADPRGLEPFIREEAAKNGVDPDIAVKVARSEGLANPVGDAGKSHGAFQLYTGGGEGNRFQQITGLDPSDPANEKATISFALKRAAEVGWTPWHGAKRVGVGPWDGITGKRADAGGPALAGSDSMSDAVNDPVVTASQEQRPAWVDPPPKASPPENTPAEAPLPPQRPSDLGEVKVGGKSIASGVTPQPVSQGGDPQQYARLLKTTNWAQNDAPLGENNDAGAGAFARDPGNRGPALAAALTGQPAPAPQAAPQAAPAPQAPPMPPQRPADLGGAPMPPQMRGGVEATTPEGRMAAFTRGRGVPPPQQGGNPLADAALSAYGGAQGQPPAPAQVAQGPQTGNTATDASPSAALKKAPAGTAIPDQSVPLAQRMEMQARANYARTGDAAQYRAEMAKATETFQKGGHYMKLEDGNTYFVPRVGQPTKFMDAKDEKYTYQSMPGVGMVALHPTDPGKSKVIIAGQQPRALTAQEQAAFKPGYMGADGTPHLAPPAAYESTDAKELAARRNQPLNEAVDSAKGTDDVRQSLKVMKNAFEAAKANGGKLPEGKFGDLFQSVKLAGKSFGLDFGNVGEGDVVQKMNAVLAAASTKAVNQRGGTQFEFKTFLGNNPGLTQSDEGRMALIDILDNLEERKQAISKIARAKDTSPENFDERVAGYDAAHPIANPFSKDKKEPLTSATILAPGAPGGSGSAPGKPRIISVEPIR